MKSTFSTLFYLRKNRLNNDGLAPIMVRITINGNITQFNSKLMALPGQWDTKIGRAKGRSVDSINLNRSLDNLKAKIDSIYNKQIDNHGCVLPETIKNILLGIDSGKVKTLVEYFTEHNDQYKLKISITTSRKTYTRYELTKTKLQKDIKSKYHVNDFLISDMNFIFIENFYLHFLQNACNNNTAMKFVQRLKTVYNYAINSGADVKANPFSQFKFRYDTVNREVLTQEEIDMIYKKKLISKR